MADITVSTPREYRDLSLTFGRNPVTSDVVAVVGVEAVRRSLKNIISTIAGEVPFFPNFGSHIQRLLFEPIDPITTILLETELQATIEAYEPRVRIVRLVVTPTPDEARYQIDLTLSLVNLSTPVTFTLYLSRLR